MYKKILIPLDGSKESEGVFPMVRDELDPDGQVILLQVVHPGKTQTIGGQVLLGSQQEEADVSRASVYLRGVARHLELPQERYRCEVTVSGSIPQGIVDFARKEGVDLIAMYTHDRKGIAALIKKSIARDVQKHAPVEVKVFKPQELVTAT